MISIRLGATLQNLRSRQTQVQLVTSWNFALITPPSTRTREFSICARKMSEQVKAPYVSQDIQAIAGLIRGLESCTKKGGQRKSTPGVSCKKTTFPVADSGGVSVDSWRFQDWDYKKRDLPTYARGLFTYRRKDGSPEIAVRGYDKFFNVGEVRETEWKNVEEGTKGPYELSVKENGCIIFISGLEGDKLLVCSKHSTGARQDVNLSHAVAGEKMMEVHLAAAGKTKGDLARELRRRNATAVAELCDDSFEEHVLAYDKKAAGLYLHGINLNLPEFVTYPGKLVHEFADEWGFKKAQYLMKDDIQTVKTFLEQCAETGSWDGRDTEGFVVRCQKKIAHNGLYEDWFFKYKFEEPYLLYRQWREVTKAVISGKTPKYKKHKEITEQYLHYARQQLAKDPALGKAFNANHGIIAMRDGFLKTRGLRGADIIRQQQTGEENSVDNVIDQVVLVPIASIGCGKTTVALALSHLFGWGHVQNDNITVTKGKPRQFATQVCNALAAHPAVVADRNNHQKRERKQLMEDIRSVIPEARFVALYYRHDPKWEMLPLIREVTRERVLARGDNHQTIHAAKKSPEEIINIMEGFLHRFEPVDPEQDPDDGFDEIIRLEVTASSRENLETVVTSLNTFYPELVQEIPTSEELENAVQTGLEDYRPDIKHDLSVKSNRSKPGNAGHKLKKDGSGQSDAPAKPPQLEYFCIRLPNEQVLSALERTFVSVPPEVFRFFRQLQKTRRVQPAFHVTLMHRASISQNPDLWSSLSSLYDSTLNSSPSDADPVLGKCRVQFERVVWDQRVMCIVARLLDEGWQSQNAVAHITVGTAGQHIKPKESNTLLEKWHEGGSGGSTGIQEVEIEGDVVLFGTVKGVTTGRS